MKTVDAWKIRRELKRPFQQLLRLPARVGGYFFAARYYDLFLARKVRQTAGSVPLSEKVAIYLIYPSFGLQQSHLVTLEHLRSKGYATLVVSNLDLTLDDRERLLPLCHICIERPNFGYDFGGYRDGVLTIEDIMPKLAHLLLINDSTWFPLPDGSDWIEESETMDVDLAAAASNYGISRVDPADYKKIRWNYVASHRNFHFCSFALLFSRAIISDQDFVLFWKKFPLSNRKERTVRRGEIGLSKWVLARGFTYGMPFNVATLQEDLAKLDDTRLREVAENLIVPEDRRMLEIKHAVLATEPSRGDLIDLVLTCVARQGSSYALADYAINERKFPFLKKSPVWLSKEASDITLRLLGSLANLQGEEIVAEAKMLRNSKTRFDAADNHE